MQSPSSRLNCESVRSSGNHEADTAPSRPSSWPGTSITKTGPEITHRRLADSLVRESYKHAPTPIRGLRDTTESSRVRSPSQDFEGSELTAGRELCLPSLERDQNRYSTSNRQVVLEASAEYEARKHAHSSFRPLVDLDSSSEAEIETTEQLPLKVSKLEQDLRQTNRQLRLGERMRQEVEEQVVSLRRDLVSRDRTISRLEGQMKQLEHKTDHILDLVDKIFQRPQPSVRESHTTPGHEEDVEMIPVTEAPSGINKSTAGATKRNISVVVDNPEYSTQNDLSEVQPKARRLGPGHNTPRGIDSRGSTPQDTEEDSQSMISSADGRPQRDSTTPSTPDEQDRAITKVTMTRRQLKAGRFEDWLPQEVRDSVLTQFADWNKRKSDWHKNSRGSATICLSRKLRKIGSNGAEADSACNDCTAEGEVCVRYNGDGSITIVPLRKKDRRGTSRDKEYWLK